MAKEMMIVFVYDTSRCRKEEDDPAEAVMYFHPTWVSLAQRLALAGQLMGVNQFLASSFAPPRFISLQGGKFVLKKFGQYMLAVGTDRNIQDWILERRANTLESMLKFFHCDLQTISVSLNNERNKFTEKLSQIFETYLPVLQYSANLFSNIPIMKLPKSASNVFLEAMQVLQYCQETNGIMGGALFYNNKVVATQLSADLTKQIVITDPYRIKAPAERIPTSFHLPVGVQLLRVYIERRQLTKLIREASGERSFSATLDSSSKKLHKKGSSKGVIKDPVISGMKRDTSRIFTVPEEVELDSGHYEDGPRSPEKPVYDSPRRRPEKLGNSSGYTPYVCTTPLSNVNQVLHNTAVSICSASEEAATGKKEPERQLEQIDDIPDVVKEALRCKRLNKLKNGPSKIPKLARDVNQRRSCSMSDLEDSLRRYSNRVTLRTYSLGLPRLNKNLAVDSPERGSPGGRNIFNTITDPHYPVFRYDGLPVSQSLYEEYISSHYEGLHESTRSESPGRNPRESLSWKVSASKPEEKALQEERERNLENSRPEKGNKSKQELYRRSMSLPLKPLSVSEGDDRRKSASECPGVFDFPQKRKLEGLQLTPLMSKLSLLADERTSGFCSRETTPSEFRDFSSFSTLTSGNQQLIRSKLEAANKDIGSEGEEELEDDWSEVHEDASLEKTELFLCGHQNMVLILLMEDGTGNNPDLVHSLWQTCINTLGKLETKLQHCLDHMPSSDNKELYSVLSIDPQWDTVHRSGLWGVTELEIISCLHDRFTSAPNLTDVVIRTEDTVVYGNQCGRVEVFYQQAIPSNTSGGLPTPADLMGVVPLKAKRRLERDHGIVLL